MRKDDDHEVALNPHRAEDLTNAARETVARLHSRGIEVSEREDPEDLVNLLTAVEDFEDAVEAHGGDLFVDDLRSSQPDDPHFVEPRREKGESLQSYTRRIEQATARLRSHPASPQGSRESND